MSLNIRLKLLTILPKMLSIGVERFKVVLEEFPEALNRSAILTLYDERGGKLTFHAGFKDGKPFVVEVDYRNPPWANNEISMHIDTFLAILKNKLDFRTAYIHDLIELKSNDGLPPTYHLLLWSAFFDKFVEVIG
jgi:hypothetical protein